MPLPKTIPSPYPSGGDARVKEAKPQRDGVFHTLGALRGVAAIGVVMFHFQHFFPPNSVPGGYLAVDLFFMMSGVVLSHAYEPRFRAGMGTREFMRARLIRLYPLYFLGFILGTAAVVASFLGNNINHWDVARLAVAIVLAVFMLPNFSGGAEGVIFPLNLPCWSLFFEILINLGFVSLWRILTSRGLVAMCVFSGCALALIVAHTGSNDHGDVVAGIAAGIIRTTFGFCVGILIARRAPAAGPSQSNLRFLAIVAVVVIVIATRVDAHWRPLWDVLCVLVVLPLVVHAGVRIDPGSRLRTVATFLGSTSYAIYVLHDPMTGVLNSLTRQHASWASSQHGIPYSGIAIIVALLVGSWLADRFYDTPMRRLLGRVTPRFRELPVNV